jgi:hypothetical protein
MPISFAFLSRSTEDVTILLIFGSWFGVAHSIIYSAELIVLVSYTVGSHFLMTPSEYSPNHYRKSSFCVFNFECLQEFETKEVGWSRKWIF